MNKIRVLLTAALAFVLLVVLWVFTGFSGAQAQVQKRHEALLEAIEDGSWGQVNGLISEAYVDRWGHDHDTLISSLRDVRRQFIMVNIEPHDGDPVSFGAGHDKREIPLAGRYKLTGSGPGSALVTTKVNNFPGDFTFTWVKEGATHWGWRLLSVEHPDVEIPPGYVPGRLYPNPEDL